VKRYAVLLLVLIAGVVFAGRYPVDYRTPQAGLYWNGTNLVTIPATNITSAPWLLSEWTNTFGPGVGVCHPGDYEWLGYHELGSRAGIHHRRGVG